MQFEEPLFLVMGAAACGLLLWRSRRLARARAAALREMAADRLVAGLTESVSAGKRRLRLGLLLLAVAALFAALARPQAGFRWEETRRRGIDIMLALDTSKSMLAKDAAPDRLERAKLSILDLLEKLEGDRVGLIPFAGEAYLMCPLTLDYDAFRQSLATADTEIVPAPGSDLANVIRVARKALDSEANHRILVLVTDGEDLEGEALAEAKRAGGEGVTVHAVGVGTPTGELVPSGGGFLRDEKGELVRSRLDEKTLRAICEATGGVYEPIGGGLGGLEAIYRERLALVPKEELMARRHKVPLERFEWALGLGGLALLLEMLAGDRKSRRAWRLPRLGRAGAGAVVLLAAAAAHASPRDGEKAFREGEFGRAAEEYRDAVDRAPGDARLHQGLAAASYKKGDFDAAAESYRRAIRTDDLKLQNEACYGLGNALFRQGQQQVAKDTKQAIARWEEALAQYDGALKLDPKDEDARFNREFVQRKLDELKEQEEQKQQDPQQQQQRDQQQAGHDGRQQDQQQAGQGPAEPQGGPEQRRPTEGDGRESEAQEGDGDPDEGKPRTRLDGGDREQDGEQGGEQEGKPAPPGGTAGSAEAAENAAEGAGEAELAAPGRMTREQARQLLDSLKEGEGQLAFVPQHLDRNRTPKRHRRDW